MSLLAWCGVHSRARDADDGQRTLTATELAAAGNHPHDARHTRLWRKEIIPGDSCDLGPGKCKTQLIEVG